MWHLFLPDLFFIYITLLIYQSFFYIKKVSLKIFYEKLITYTKISISKTKKIKFSQQTFLHLKKNLVKKLNPEIIT